MLYKVFLEFDCSKTWLPYSKELFVEFDPSSLISVPTQFWRWVWKQYGSDVVSGMCWPAKEEDKLSVG